MVALYKLKGIKKMIKLPIGSSAWSVRWNKDFEDKALFIPKGPMKEKRLLLEYPNF